MKYEAKVTAIGESVLSFMKIQAKDDYKRVRDELQLEDIIPAAETL